MVTYFEIIWLFDYMQSRKQQTLFSDICGVNRNILPLLLKGPFFSYPLYHAHSSKKVKVSYQLCGPLVLSHSTTLNAGEDLSSLKPSKTPSNGPFLSLAVFSGEGPLFPSWRSSCVRARSVQPGLGLHTEPTHPQLGQRLWSTPLSSGNISPTTLYA